MGEKEDKQSPDKNTEDGKSLTSPGRDAEARERLDENLERDSGQQDIKDILLEERGEVKQELIEIAARDVERSKQHEAELAKEKADKKETFYSGLIYTLTNLRYDEQEARVLWVNLLAHKLEMSDRLDRNVGIRVAALDYFRNILGALDDVKIIDASRYIETAQLAVTDGLTGVFNHRYFQDRLLRDINRADEMASKVTLLMIDIDFFKQYNDINGHIAGDVALKEVASALRRNLKRDDLVARYGGEEFAVILVGIGRESAKAVAERIRKRIREMDFPNEKVLPGGQLTISIGLATYPDDAIERGAMISAADRALYLAKNAGKNRVELAPADQRKEIRIALALDLTYRRADAPAKDTHPARTTNLSFTGLCMFAADKIEVGQVLYLDMKDIADNEPIMARVMWQHTHSDGHTQAGLKFVNLNLQIMEKIRGFMMPRES